MRNRTKSREYALQMLYQADIRHTAREQVQAEFWQVFHGCLDQMPEQQRTLFALRELDGIETDVLVETLKISSKNNLWVMLSRARERIRRCLQSQWFTPEA